MKTMNKTIIIFLILSVLLPVFTTYGTLDEMGVVQDIKDTKNYQKLLALGFLEDDDEIFYDEYATRGALTKYVVRICGFGDLALGNNAYNPFSDLDKSHIYYNEILTAYNMGIIQGVTETIFAPDEYITLDAAIKIFMSALGYQELAEKRGGYPVGYRVTAQPLGLLSNIVQDGQSNITIEQFLQMLVNALDVEIMQVSAIISSDGREFLKQTVNEKETILTQVFNIYDVSGIIEANAYTSLYGESDLRKGEVSIDGIVYKVGSTNAFELLGYAIEGYYKEDDLGQYELLYVNVNESKNNVVVIESKNIGKNVTNTEFHYYDEEQDKYFTEKISKTATLIYNGGQIGIKKEYLSPTYGYVTLIDNNNDSLIDVIHVMSYRIIQVSNVSDTSYVVSDALGGKSIVLDPDDNSYDVVIYKDGEPGSFADISEKNIISYAEPIGDKKNIKYLHISSKTITGSVTTIAEDEIVIDDKQFPVTEDLYQRISLGLSGTFYQDYTGRIVAYRAESDIVYGYLNGLERKGAFKDKIVAEIFTENNRWVRLELKDRIYFNDSTINAKKFFETYGGKTTEFRQLITYKVSNDGYITSINFAEKAEPWSDEELELIQQNKFRLSRQLPSSVYRSSMYSFNNDVGLSASTKVFLIPEQKEGEWADRKNFSVTNRASLENTKTYRNIYAYDANEAGIAKVCVLIGNEPTISQDANFMIVNSIVKMYLNDGETTYGVKGTYGGEMLSIPVKDVKIVEEEDLDKGDIIMFSLGVDGTIEVISKLYDYSNGTNQRFMTGSVWALSTKVAGCVKYIDNDNSRVVLDYNTGTGLFSNSSVSNVYIYNTKNDTVTKGSFDDVEVGSYIFATARYLQFREVVVFQ